MTTTASPSSPEPASYQMLRMLNSFLTVQALHVAAVLDLAGRLADGPRGADDLASDTGADRDALYRLLRMLTGLGVFSEETDGQFAATSLGATLRSDSPDSVRDWALFVGAPEMWEVWGGLHGSVLTGDAAFPRAHGAGMWDFLAEHPDLGDAFNRWMTRQSDQQNTALVASYDFSSLHVLADVGGGQGSTLAAILQANPSLRGILIDLPSVVSDASPLRVADVDDRCEVIGGDMFDAVPLGADAYLIKRVLMDWGDEPALAILRTCAAAMPDDGKVVVVEMLLAPGNDPSPGKPFDILMLLNQPGGRIRTEAEFHRLFSAAGLRLARVVPTASQNSILEGVRA